MKNKNQKEPAGVTPPVQENGLWAFLIAAAITAVIGLAVKYLL